MLSILIVVSITQKGPIIFLRLSEKSKGAYDGIISSSSQDGEDFDDYYDNGWYLNYTQVQTVTNDEYNLSPRLQFCTAYNLDTGVYKSLCVMLMDTDRETEIGLGSDYPYEPLAAGECLIPSIFATDFSVGDEFEIYVSLYELTDTQSNFYN